MDYEEIIVKLQWKDGRRTKELLEIYEEAPGDEEFVLLKLTLNNEILSSKSENCFEAFVQLRQYLEQRSIQIHCNGAALNVYPSPMALSMGVGRVAYKLYLGRKAEMKDLVDIFDYDEDLHFVTINEQLNFY